MNRAPLGFFQREARWMAGSIVAVVVIGLLAALFIPLFHDWREEKMIERCQEVGGRYEVKSGKCDVSPSH